MTLVTLRTSVVLGAVMEANAPSLLSVSILARGTKIVGETYAALMACAIPRAIVNME